MKVAGSTADVKSWYELHPGCDRAGSTSASSASLTDFTASGFAERTATT